MWEEGYIKVNNPKVGMESSLAFLGFLLLFRAEA